MQLKLRRSQRSAGMLGRSVMFMLDARLELTEEEAANVKKYGLGDEVIYNSAASQNHAEAAAEAVARDSVGSFLNVLAQAAMHRLSLNITIDGLVRAQHVECKDLAELIAAEKAIRQAAHTTRAFLETARTFDGREIVVDLEAEHQIVA
jgi:hypothetical protein